MMEDGDYPAPPSPAVTRRMNHLSMAAAIFGGGLPIMQRATRPSPLVNWQPAGDISQAVNPHVESKRQKRARLQAEKEARKAASNS